MPEPVFNLAYIEYDGERATPVTRPVIAETPWVLYVDRRELVTFCVASFILNLALVLLRFPRLGTAAAIMMPMLSQRPIGL